MRAHTRLQRPTVSLFLIDDNAAFRRSIRALVEPESSLRLLGEAEDGTTAIRLVGELLPDLVLMDVIMPGLNGIETTRQIVLGYPAVKVLGLSVHADDRFAAAMQDAGASGYVLKDRVLEELTTAIHAVISGQTYFPPRAT